VNHYVALSIVASGLRYTIVRATQFQEFTEDITAGLTVRDEVRAPDPLNHAEIDEMVVSTRPSPPKRWFGRGLNRA
jgi:hypothetical protein